MRPSYRSLAGLAFAGLMTLGMATGARADKQELLGIHIWRTWRDVLGKFGQPTRIEVGAVTTPITGAASSGTGNLLGGGAGLPGLGGMGMMGGPPGMPGMARGMMGGPGGMSGYAQGYMQSMMRGRGMGSPYGGYPGAPGGMMGGPMGKAGMMAGAMGGEEGPAAAGPGMAGGGMLSGAPGMPGAPAGPGIGAPGGLGNLQVQSTGEGEVTWIYQKGQLTYLFLFNKDGRVIQIQEFGRSGGGPTVRGVRLGDPVGKVYRLYGWANSSATNGNELTLDYGRKAQVAFQLLDEGHGAKVVGITVALTEKNEIPGG